MTVPVEKEGARVTDVKADEPLGTHVLELEIAEVIDETADARSLVFTSPADAPVAPEKLRYDPGQFLTLRVPSDLTGSVARCYSLCSSPFTGDPMTVTVKRTADGYALIDEAILPLVADQVPIEWAGDIYCIVLHHCHKLADLPRMRSWTQSMEQWCGLSGSVPYGGVCDVHRLQVQVHTDDYRLLEDRLGTSSRTLAEVNTWAAAEGYYQLGEVRRLMGDLDGAARAFEQARTLGKDPQPGEALLACRRGDSAAAWTAIRLALAGGDRLERMRLLRAAVEIALGRDAVDEAETYCSELETDAAAFKTPGFLAWAAHARGAVAMRQGRFDEALASLLARRDEARQTFQRDRPSAPNPRLFQPEKTPAEFSVKPSAVAEAKPDEPSQAAGDDSTTSRLLAAKRKARRRKK